MVATTKSKSNKKGTFASALVTVQFFSRLRLEVEGVTWQWFFRRFRVSILAILSLNGVWVLYSSLALCTLIFLYT